MNDSAKPPLDAGGFSSEAIAAPGAAHPHLRRAAIAAAVGMAVLIAIAGASLAVNWRLVDRAESLLAQTDTVLGELRDAARQLRAIETQLFREATRAGSASATRLREFAAQLERSTVRLTALVADEPWQLARARRLRELVRLLPRTEDGAPDVAREQAETALALLDESVGLTSTMAEFEGSLRRAREAELDRYTAQARMIALVIFAIGAAIGASALVLAMVLVRRHVAMQQSHLAQLAATRDAADAANRGKSLFLSAASHDLRQPLHALALFASALRRRVSGDEATRLVLQIEAAVSSMTGMFATLLDVSRLEAGAIEPDLRAVRLDEIFARLGSEFAQRARAKGLSLRVVPSGLWVRTDPTLLETALRNLLSNAVKFTTEGKVLLGARRRGGGVRVAVHDTGGGIPAADRQRVFEEFVRLRPGDGPSEGLGLGLAITRRMAALIEAPLGLDSRLGRGSVFWLDLQRIVAPEVQGVAHAAPTPMPGAAAIVLEDDARNREAVARELGDAGIAVAAVGDLDGFDAELAAYSDGRRAAAAPDLLLVDLDIRGERIGIDAVRSARRRFGHGLPALIVTGSTDRETIALLSGSGLAWLTKPVAPQDLRNAVAAALAARAAPVRG